MELDPAVLTSRPTVDNHRRYIRGQKFDWVLKTAVVFRTEGEKGRTITYRNEGDRRLAGVLVDIDQKIIRIIICQNGTLSTATFQQLDGRKTVVALVFENNSRRWTPGIRF